MAPQPKHPSARARRNKTSTIAVLRAVENARIPDPPKHQDWHPLALDWWCSAWTSPMRQEWTESDEHGIIRMLALQHAYWTHFDSGEYRGLSSLENSFNASARMYGLSPMARRSLQWQIEQGEAAEEKTVQRRAKKSASKNGIKALPDPREMLG